MATWADIKSYVQANYSIEYMSGDVIILRFATNDEGRSQAVVLIRQALGPEEWLAIESPIAELDTVDLRDALQHVGRLVCGGLSTFDTKLTLRHSIPIANLDVNEFLDPLAYIVGGADSIENALTGSDTF